MRFLTDLKVSFENNQAERDTKIMKVKQKISETLGKREELKLSAELGRILLQPRKTGLLVKKEI